MHLSLGLLWEMLVKQHYLLDCFEVAGTISITVINDECTFEYNLYSLQFIDTFECYKSVIASSRKTQMLQSNQY